MIRIARLALLAIIPLVVVVTRTASAQRADSARVGVRTRSDTSAQKRPPAPRVKVARDSLDPPISPGKAFLLSAAVPGLGQARLNRPTAGAVYVTTEAIWVAMLVKAANDLHIAKRYQNEVIVKSWKVNPTTGEPEVANGAFVVKDTLRSRYAQPVTTGTTTGAEAQQRSRVKARRLHLEDWVAMLLFNHLFSGADAFVSSQLWDLPAQVEVRSLPAGIGLGAKVRFR